MRKLVSGLVCFTILFGFMFFQSNAASVTIQNDTVWTDTSGNAILCQGGSMYVENGTYYWFGMEMYSNSIFYGFRCYSSTDLKNWTNCGYVLQAGQCPELTNPGWVGRPSILKNPNTNKYVIVFEYSNPSLNIYRNRLAFAESSTICGQNYTWKGMETIEGNSMGDQGAFQIGSDAYVACTYDTGINQNLNSQIGIFKLDPTDYIGIDSKIYGASNGPGIEAHYIFQKDGYYYWFASQLNGWLSSSTKYAKSTSLAGPWVFSTLPTSPSSTDSYNSQHDFILPITGSSTTTYMYFGDRWSNRTGIGTGKYVWFPLSWNGTTPTLNCLTSWSIDTDTGTWSDPTPTPTPTPSGSVFNPSADTYVRSGSYAGQNFGTAATIVVKNDTAEYYRKAYAKFDYGSFSGGSAASAKLRLNVASVGTDASRTIKIYGTSDETWNETGTTWNNAPTGSTYIGSITVGNTLNTWYELDVTGYVNNNMSDKIVSFLVIIEGTQSSNGSVEFNSREAASNKPELVLQAPSSVFNPAADTYVRSGSYAGQNFGTAATIVVKNDTSEYYRKAYARFDYGSFYGGSATSAKLRLNVASLGTDASRTIKIYGTSDETWNETGTTWNNAPAGSTYIGSITIGNTLNTWYELDVTGYVNSNMSDKIVSFLLIIEGTQSSNGSVEFNSREAASNKPELVIQ